jgi:protein BUR2
MARRQHSQSQWLFTAEELRRTPSVLEGLPIAEELTNRAKGVNFITQVGIALKLPQLTLATACVYLHRFFMRHSMPTRTKPGIHHYSVAATALFLATKVEENCRKMKELVVACCRVAQKNPDLIVDDQDKEFWRWRDTILSEEDRLLESLCFDLQLEQPYRILFDFMCYYNVQDNKRLRNAAWAFLNDSHNTTMCLRFPAKVIAGVAFYGGAAQADVQLPDDEKGRPWWKHLDLDILDINEAWNLMVEVYDTASLPQQKEKGAYARIDDFATFDQTRSAASPGYGQSPAASVAGSQAGQKHDRDDDQNGAWGASPKRQRRDSGPKDMPQSGSRIPPPNGVPPPLNGSLSGSRVPPPPPIAVPATTVNGESNDPAEVQRRIDSIISASGRVPPPHPPPPPLSRVSSQQDQSPALSRRPSYQEVGRRSTSSHSNQPQHWQPPPQPGSGDYNGIPSHQIPPLPQGDAYGGYKEPPPLPRIPSGEYDNRPPYNGHQNLPQRPSYEDDRRSYGQERRRSHEYRPEDRGPYQQGRYNNGSGHPDAARRPPDEGQIPDNGSEEGEL